ncbi:MAG: histidine--tRNA ligase [Planctomycetota bacterium]
MHVQALRGFRDYLPKEMLAKDGMLRTVCRVFESFGYPPIQTPALEYSSVLLGKYGEEGELLMYRFEDNGGRDVCMRYDLTVPLARVVAEHGDLRMPFRRYQIAPVWRAEKPGKGRYREFLQCDVDLVGVNSAAADAEMILVACSVLRALGVERFQLRLNHRGTLRGLTETLDLHGADEADFLRLLDKLDKIGEEKLAAAFAERFAFDERRQQLVREFCTAGQGARETLALLRGLVGSVPAASEGLDRLVAVLDLVEGAGEGHHVIVDPTIARGLSYYTGCIYETRLLDLTEYGSVMSGGRYDELVGVFAQRELPAVGVSLGVDRLFSALQELGMVGACETPAQVMLVHFSETLVDSLRVAARLRECGISVLLYPEAAKVKKQFQYAGSAGIPFTAVIGATEAARGTLNLKDMASGEQSELTLDQVVARLRAAVKASP